MPGTGHETPTGETLYWDYYCYVKEHPVRRWDTPTSILCGGRDELCEPDVTARFARQYGCRLLTRPEAGHYFHTPKGWGSAAMADGKPLSRRHIQTEQEEKSMAMEKITENRVAIALVTGTCALTDEQTALDLIMEARYTLGAERIAIEKAAVSPDFFILSTGLAGAVLQNSSITAQSWRCTAIIPDIPASPCGFYPREQPGQDIFPRHPAGSHPPSGRGVTACGAAAADAFRHAVPAPRPQPYRLAKPGLEQVQKVKQNPPRSKRVRRAVLYNRRAYAAAFACASATRLSASACACATRSSASACTCATRSPLPHGLAPRQLRLHQAGLPLGLQRLKLGVTGSALCSLCQPASSSASI